MMLVSLWQCTVLVISPTICRVASVVVADTTMTRQFIHVVDHVTLAIRYVVVLVAPMWALVMTLVVSEVPNVVPVRPVVLTVLTMLVAMVVMLVVVVMVVVTVTGALVTPQRVPVITFFSSANVPNAQRILSTIVYVPRVVGAFVVCFILTNVSIVGTHHVMRQPAPIHTGYRRRPSPVHPTWTLAMPCQ